MKLTGLFIIIIGLFLILSVVEVKAFQLEKHLVQTEVDANYPCHIEGADTIVCPALEQKQIDDWQTAITDLKPEEKDKGKLKDSDKLNYLFNKVAPYEGKTSKLITINKEYREKVDVQNLDTEIKIGFNTNIFGVSGTPLENFDVNTTTGMVRYRPLNMTWLNFASTNKITTPLSFTKSKYNYTYSVWIKTSDAGGTSNPSKCIIEQELDFDLCNIYGTAWVYWRNNGANTISSTVKINDSIWHNIVVTYANSTTNVSLFLDGVILNSSIIPAWASSVSKIVSYGSSVAGYSYVGLIDSLRIYNSTLNITEINRIYANNRTRNLNVLGTLNDNSQILYLPLNENSGTFTSGINSINNGTITGATWQSDNINVTTLGYQVNISIVSITNAYIYWDNGTTINSSFNGNKTFSYFNAQTIWIKEGFCQDSLYYFNESTLTCKLSKTRGDLTCDKLNDVYSLSIVFLGLIILCSMVMIIVRITQGYPFDNFIQKLFYILLISIIPLVLGIIILQAMFPGCG